MVEYSNVNVKLSDTQLKTLKTAVKDKIGTTLRMSLKIFNGKKLYHMNCHLQQDIRNNNSCFSNWCRNSVKMHGSGTTTLIISNEEMNDIMKIAQALEDSNILLKGVTKTIKNENEDF